MSVITETAAPRDVLRIADLSAEQLGHVLHLSAQMKAHPTSWGGALRGQSVACLFEKPSTRTRVSFEAAAQHLGILPIMLRPDELQLGRGEPISDTARVLSSYVSAIVVRTFAQRTLDEIAAWASVPVVNALSNEHHPCQALADLLTLQEHFGDLRGRRLAYVGDANNVARSLIEAGARTGLHVTIGAPIGYQPDPQIVAEAHQQALDRGGSIRVTDDPRAAVAASDAIYTDVWVSMGSEDERDRRLQNLAAYQVTADLMALAAPHAVFMHCLPAHRGQEVSAAVIDGPASIVWQQAANRMPTEQALLYLLITGAWPGERHVHELPALA